MITRIIQRVDGFISSHDKAKQYAADYGAFIHDVLKTQFSRDGVIFALLLERVALADAAKALLLLAAASIVGAVLMKKACKNYGHIKGLAEDFLEHVDVFGVVKETVSDIAGDACKKMDDE